MISDLLWTGNGLSPVLVDERVGDGEKGPETRFSIR